MLAPPALLSSAKVCAVQGHALSWCWLLVVHRIKCLMARCPKYKALTHWAMLQLTRRVKHHLPGLRCWCRPAAWIPMPPSLLPFGEKVSLYEHAECGSLLHRSPKASP